MDWFKKHADTIVIMSSFALCFWTLNEKMDDKFNNIRSQISALDKELSIIKTVLIMQKIMPLDLCHHEEKLKD